MRAARRGAALAAALMVVFGAFPAEADDPSGATALAACYGALGAPTDASVGTRVCRTAQSFVWGTAATCRMAAGDQCQVIDGRTVSQAKVDAYLAGGVHRALQLQRDLAAGEPLWDEQINHTHNSFNSSAYQLPDGDGVPSYYPTLTNQDPNQVLTLAQQLDVDVRFLELDLHWVASPYGTAATGGKWVTLCHGNSSNPLQIHVGCTADRPFDDGLAEIRAWLDAHPGEFLFLYLENQLSNDPAAHELAGQLLDAAFPDPWIARPPAGQPCADMPVTETRAALQQTGARVLIVGNCDAGNGSTTAWGRAVHQRGPLWDEDGDASRYDAAACADDQAARRAHTSFRRLYSDSTWLTAMLDHDTIISAPGASAMQQCGVNIIGLDQLVPDDDRLAALAWSWTPEQALAPSGDCAVQAGTSVSASRRFAGAPCDEAHPFACVTSDGAWHVTSTEGSWTDGPSACTEFAGSRFAVPTNGFRNELLRQARAATITPVWLNYRSVGGVWTPNAA